MQNHCLVPFASFSLRLLLPGHVTIQHHPCGHAAAVSALHATSHATPLPLTANPAYHSASVPIRDEREGSVRVGMSLWSTRKIQVKPIFSNDPLQQPPLSLHPLPPSQTFTIARDVVEANVKRTTFPVLLAIPAVAHHGRSHQTHGHTPSCGGVALLSARRVVDATPWDEHRTANARRIRMFFLHYPLVAKSLSVNCTSCPELPTSNTSHPHTTMLTCPHATAVLDRSPLSKLHFHIIFKKISSSFARRQPAATKLSL
jgi:hypothetical protein